jgi:DNA-binding transcriptional LysR family regulator
MNYTLNQLHIFLKVVQSESVTKASEELHLTQPAVSIQLKNFQNQFDIPLTEVVGRKIYITDFGKEVALAAEKIISEVNTLNYKKLAYKGKLTGKLKISIVSTAKYVMPYFLADFLKLYPGIELQMDVTNKSGVLESLEKNEVDFALVSVLPETIQTNHIELLKNKLYVIDGFQKTYKKQQYSSSFFETIPLIYREKGSGTRLVMERYISNNKLPVVKKMELATNEAVKQAVIAGLGASIMPIIGLKNEIQNQELQIIPVKGFPIESNWNICWLKDKKLSAVAESYLEFINQEKNRIIKEKFGWYEGY